MHLIQQYINQANALNELDAQVENESSQWSFHAVLGWALPDDHWLTIDVTGQDIQQEIARDKYETFVTAYQPVKATVTTWQGEYICELPVSQLDLDISTIIEDNFNCVEMA